LLRAGFIGVWANILVIPLNQSTLLSIKERRLNINLRVGLFSQTSDWRMHPMKMISIKSSLHIITALVHREASVGLFVFYA
jgi:hypothetical protein